MGASTALLNSIFQKGGGVTRFVESDFEGNFDTFTIINPGTGYTGYNNTGQGLASPSGGSGTGGRIYYQSSGGQVTFAMIDSYSSDNGGYTTYKVGDIITLVDLNSSGSNATARVTSLSDFKKKRINPYGYGLVLSRWYNSQFNPTPTIYYYYELYWNNNLIYKLPYETTRSAGWPPGNYGSVVNPSVPIWHVDYDHSSEGQGAYKDGYLTQYIGANTVHGSHFFTGTFQSQGAIVTNNDGSDVPNNIKQQWSYSLKQTYGPPYYYRNTLTIDDEGASGDQDFDDFVIRADGECFFNGPLLKTTAVTKAPTTENVTLVGAANEDWAMYDIDDFNFVINKATQITFVTTRSTNYCTKILLVKDSSNYKIITSPSVNPTIDTFTGNTGTYKIGIRRTTSSNPSSCVSAPYESSTVPRIWVQNTDPHL